MTERSGGSDVSGTETVARREGGMFRLYGEKWFTSATTSELALTLARIEDSRDLSLFLVRLRDEQGRKNNIRIERLKDKLGTRALPTAELLLEGTPARLIGGEGRGVKKIATMLNITRLYNACCAVGFMRRGLALARDYASRRHAFGKLLSEHPLHIETLASLQVGFEGSFHLVFFAAQLLGRDEVGTATVQERRILRLLTPSRSCLPRRWQCRRPARSWNALAAQDMWRIQGCRSCSGTARCCPFGRGRRMS